MVASTDIKFYVHTNTNAPQLQNAFGCMIDVLDACLINGFGAQTVATLTANGTTVTATFGSAHNYLQYQVIKIAGANQTEFNGEHRILTMPNANTITFELAAVPSVTTATGTITSSLPSLGWLKPFSGTGKAAYRSSNTLLASRPYLRVVDALDAAYSATYAKFAKVGIVETMTDIDTMSGVQAPYDSAAPTKNWVGTGSGTTAINGWAKWYYSMFNAASGNNVENSTPAAGNRQWILVGSGDYFYFFPTTAVSSTDALTYGFGNFKTLLNTDSSNNFLSATYNYVSVSSSYFRSTYTALSGNQSTQKLLLQRAYNQSSAYKESSNISLSVGSYYSGLSNYVGQYSLTNICPLLPVFINESVLRGEIPNFYHIFQQKPYVNKTVIENGGTIFMAIDIAGGSAVGQVAVKIGDL